jgi:catechol 2,3-dioxygenase-like lactoylglutathione lyase family enzyme
LNVHDARPVLGGVNPFVKDVKATVAFYRSLGLVIEDNHPRGAHHVEVKMLAPFCHKARVLFSLDEAVYAPGRKHCKIVGGRYSPVQHGRESYTHPPQSDED